MNSNNRRRRLVNTALLALAVVSSAAACAGCSCSDDAPPRSRMGSMPFPGLFTLYGTADVNHLGRHRYRNCPRLFQEDEKERGIMYTTRAGFLDLAHVRVAIDKVRYCAVQVRRGIEEDKTELALTGPNFSIFHVSLRYPEDWTGLPPDDRAKVIDEASIRIGQQIGYLMLIWHEIITWFGYSTVPLVPETRSSFSYEDTMSHIVGLRVAEQALRSSTSSFDDAVTAALSAELASLGVVTPDQTTEAARAVEGLWWAGEQPLKRHLDTGLDDGVVYPWLIPNLPFACSAEPEPFHLPQLDDVLGHDLRDLYTVEIDPRILQGYRIRKQLPDRPTLMRHDRDIPVLMEVVRSQMQEQFGALIERPWPPSPGAPDPDPDVAMPASPAIPEQTPEPVAPVAASEGDTDGGK